MRSPPPRRRPASPRAVEMPRWPDVGYDPNRLSALRADTVAAIESLRVLSSDDPAAWNAVLASRVTREHLEQTWMPLIDRILASEAMVTWRISGLRNDLLGEVLARQAQQIVASGDAAETTAFALLLGISSLDPSAIDAFFAELGGSGTARLLLELGVPDPYRDAEACRLLAHVVRHDLSSATQRDGLPAGFAEDLVTGLTRGYDEPQRGLDPAAALTFLLHDVEYSGQFLVDMSRAVVDHEHATAVWRNPGEPTWPPSALGSRLSAADDIDPDPLEILVERLSRDGEAARALLTDRDVARYLLAERQFSPEGFAHLAAAAEVAAAGSDVAPDAPDPLLHDAAFVASAFVQHFGSRRNLMEMPAEVSVSTAHILGRHMFAMHKEVLNPEPVEEPDTMTRSLDALGPDFATEVPLYDEESLAALTDLAVDTEDGLATMRAALNDYEVGYVATAVAASMRVEHQEPDEFLEQAIGQLGQLEAYLLQHAGHLAEGKERQRDEAIGRWVDSAFTFASFGTGKLGLSVPGPLINSAAVKARWATGEATAERTFDENAREWTETLRYVWFRELHSAGLIAPNLPRSVLTSDRQLKAWHELDATERRIVQDRMEENAWRGPVDVDWLRLSEAIKSAQQDLYDDLD
jgi:hypothetical protein